MIGQSGRTVHPKLYIGVAISGQMHHMVGIRDAETVVAINQDPQAPIFEFCDLGLVGDYKEILPSSSSRLSKGSVKEASHRVSSCCWTR
jgi:electron transfer flavoprotein alpha subunit